MRRVRLTYSYNTDMYLEWNKISSSNLTTWYYRQKNEVSACSVRLLSRYDQVSSNRLIVQIGIFNMPIFQVQFDDLTHKILNWHSVLLALCQCYAESVFHVFLMCFSWTRKSFWKSMAKWYIWQYTIEYCVYWGWIIHYDIFLL